MRWVLPNDILSRRLPSTSAPSSGGRLRDHFGLCRRAGDDVAGEGEGRRVARNERAQEASNIQSRPYGRV